MEETLPVTISASQSLLQRYVKFKGVINKQEALINFQTLAAGWYEVEEDITEIEIYIVNSQEYIEQSDTENFGVLSEIADDLSIYTKSKKVTCFLAITDNEILLLDKEPKVLSGYITIKVKKVINEIAKTKGLLTLP